MYLTQRSRSAIVIAAGCLLAILLGFGITKLTYATGHQWVTVGGTSVDVRLFALPALLGFKLLMSVGYVLFVIQGFRTHSGWGLSILVFPVVALAFLFAHPRQAKFPAVVWAIGVGLLLIALIWVAVL